MHSVILYFYVKYLACLYFLLEIINQLDHKQSYNYSKLTIKLSSTLVKSIF